MCSIEECEENNWGLGAKGVCENITDTCLCPAGFTGSDAFLAYNDCHLNKNTYATVFPAVAALTCFGLATMIYFVLIISLKLYNLQKHGPQLTSSSKEIQSATNTQSDRAVTTGSKPVQRQESSQKLDVKIHAAIIRRNRTHLVVVVNFLVFLAGVLPLQLTLATNGDVFETPVSPIVWILFGIGWGEFWAGCWAFLYVYLRTLPDVPALCRLLGIQSVFVRYPNFLFRMASFIAIASGCGYIVCAIVVIAAPNKDPEAFANVRLFPMWNVFCMFFLAVFFIPVSMIMSRIFNLALNSPTQGANMGRVKRAVLNLMLARSAMWLVAVVQVPVYAFLATTFAMRYFHVYLIMSAFVAESSVVFAAYLMATDNLGSRGSSQAPTP